MHRYIYLKIKYTRKSFISSVLNLKIFNTLMESAFILFFLSLLAYKTNKTKEPILKQTNFFSEWTLKSLLIYVIEIVNKHFVPSMATFSQNFSTDFCPWKTYFRIYSKKNERLYHINSECIFKYHRPFTKRNLHRIQWCINHRNIQTWNLPWLYYWQVETDIIGKLKHIQSVQMNVKLDIDKWFVSDLLNMEYM